MEPEMDRWFGAVSALMPALYRVVVVSKVLSWKAKLSFNQLIYVLTPHLRSWALGSDQKKPDHRYKQPKWVAQRDASLSLEALWTCQTGSKLQGRLRVCWRGLHTLSGQGAPRDARGGAGKCCGKREVWSDPLVCSQCGRLCGESMARQETLHMNTKK